MKVKKIRAGSFSGALSYDNQLFIWGKGSFGEFRQPHRVRHGDGITIHDFRISNGGLAVFQTHNGQLYTWGDNKYGQLGHGDHEPRLSPTPVNALSTKRVTSFAIGHSFVIALGANIDQGGPKRSPSKSRWKNRRESQKRLHSANPIARAGANKGFAQMSNSLNRSMNLQAMNQSSHSPLRDRGRSSPNRSDYRLGGTQKMVDPPPSIMKHQATDYNRRSGSPLRVSMNRDTNTSYLLRDRSSPVRKTPSPFKSSFERHPLRESPKRASTTIGDSTQLLR